MKNLLDEKPNIKLNSRLNFSIKLVKNEDIENKNVLDIGCGFGWFELNALRRDVSHISGIEITREDLKAASKNIKNKRASFKVGGALKLPFKDNYFDTVVAWEVLEHIPKNTENKMFKEVNRVLKKKGVFYLSTPFDSFYSTYLDPAFWLTGHRHYSKEKLVKLGKDNNFKVSEVYIKGDLWSIISLLDFYFSKWIFRRTQFFENFFEKKEKKAYSQNKNGIMGIFIRYEK